MSGSLGFTRVLHVSVNSAADPASTRGFYANLLGEPSARPAVEGVDGTWFGAGQMHLVETPGTGSRGLHWCLGVVSLPAAVEALESRGIPYETGSQTWPDGRVVGQVWFSDPTGAVIELQEDPAQASAT